MSVINAKSLREKTSQELNVQLLLTKKNMFDGVVKSSSGESIKPHEKREGKRLIARIRAILRERELRDGLRGCSLCGTCALPEVSTARALGPHNIDGLGELRAVHSARPVKLRIPHRAHVGDLGIAERDDIGELLRGPGELESQR